MEPLVDHLLPRRGSKLKARIRHEDKTNTVCTSPASRSAASSFAQRSKLFSGFDAIPSATELK